MNRADVVPCKGRTADGVPVSRPGQWRGRHIGTGRTQATRLRSDNFKFLSYLLTKSLVRDSYFLTQATKSLVRGFLLTTTGRGSCRSGWII